MGSAATRSASAPGCWSRRGRARAMVRSTASSSARVVGEARRRAAGRATAMELVAGTAPSRNSLGRTTRASASVPVVKKPPAVVVPEQVDQLRGRLDGPLAPERLSGPLGQADAGLDQPGVVGSHGQVAGPPALPAAHQPPARSTWRPTGTRRSPPPVDRSRPGPSPRRPRPAWPTAMAFHSVSTFSSRAGWTRRAVPRRGGPGPLRSRAGVRAVRRRDAPGWTGPSQLPRVGDAVPVGRRRDQSGGEQLAQLVEREGGVAAFDSSGVGVERGVERALGRGQVAEHEVQGLGHHAEIIARARVLPGVEIGPGQQGLVGEHLLEVRAPASACRSSSGRSRRPGGRRCRPPPWRRGSGQRHVAGVRRLGAAAAGVPQAELDQGGPREFGRRAEATPLGVEAHAEAGDDVAPRRRRRPGRSSATTSGTAAAAWSRPGSFPCARRRPARRPASRPALARWPRPDPAPGPRVGTTACRGAPPVGSRSRRRRGGRRACRRPTWAIPPTRSAPGWRPCRRRRGRAAPRGRP